MTIEAALVEEVKVSLTEINNQKPRRLGLFHVFFFLRLPCVIYASFSKIFTFFLLQMVSRHSRTATTRNHFHPGKFSPLKQVDESSST